MGARAIRKGRPVRLSGAWYDSPWRIAGHAIGTALALVMVGIFLALFLVPRLSGGASLTVLTGSMEPTFSPGDVIVVRGIDAADVCAEVGVGQIVTFYPQPNDPALISHRVIGKTIGTYDDGTSCRLITQGDANSAVDAPVSPQQVRGTFLYGVPKLGWARQWVGDNLQTVLVVGAVALVAVGIASSMRKPRTRVYAPPAAPGDAGAPEAPLVPTGPVLDAGELAQDRALRERDLDLRERELALRERELDLARQQAGLTGRGALGGGTSADPWPDLVARAAEPDPWHDPQPPTDPVPVPAPLPEHPTPDRIEA
jgi:signal peptidase